LAGAPIATCVRVTVTTLPEPRTITVIDGDIARRDRIVVALEGAGYRTLAIGDTDDALARIDAESPALIVLAWAAPVVREMQLFDALLAEPRRAAIPVVVLAEEATASRVPAHAAAVLGRSARMRTLLGVIARLSGSSDTAEIHDPAPRRRRRTFVRACRVVSRTLVDVDSDGVEADADTARFVDQDTAGPT
jgi:CheY-like chemotaxis protein